MSKADNEKQYMIFLKYTLEYLSQATGYSIGHLSRIASGAKVPGEVFIGVCCHNLRESQDDLFSLVEPLKATIDPALIGHPDQDLLATIDELAAWLTKAECKIKALLDELQQYFRT